MDEDSVMIRPIDIFTPYQTAQIQPWAMSESCTKSYSKQITHQRGSRSDNEP